MLAGAAGVPGRRNYRGRDALPRRRRGSTSSTTCTATAWPTPTAGSRTPPTRAPGRGRRRRTRSPTEVLGGPAAARASSPPRLEELVHAGAVGVPVWRGERAFSTRRDPGQEHAVLRVREADGSDARAGRPDGARPRRHHDARRLVAVVGGRPAGLPALHRRRRGVAAVRARRRHRRGARRPDRPLPLLPRRPGCPAARSCSTCAGSRPTRCPPARSSSTAGCGATGSAPTPTTTSWCTARAATRPRYFGVAHQPRRPLAGRLGARSAPRPRDDVWIADLAGDGALREFQVGVDAADRRPGWPATAGSGC